MNSETIDTIVEIFNEKILTPVLFMVETERGVALVGFFDRAVSDDDILSTSQAIYDETGCVAEILDIREFSEGERFEFVNTAELVYSASDLVQSIFAMSMLEDFNIMIDKREKMLQRYKEFNTPYLQ